jgi:TonB family protein
MYIDKSWRNRTSVVVGVFLCLAMNLGCGVTQELLPRDPVINTASRSAIYTLNPALVTRAYRDAMKAVGAEIVVESGGTLVGRIRQGSQDIQVHTSVLPTGAGTEAIVTFEYWMDYPRFVHYAHEIEIAATRMLMAESSVRRVPEYVYPEGASSCALPYDVDHASAKPPAFVDGPRAIDQTLGYHPKAAEAGIEGEVYILAVIGVEGRVTCAEVISGLPHGLNQNAIAAVLRTRFHPARVGEQAVPSAHLFPVMFRIDRR